MRIEQISFEQELERHGELIYRNVGDSMLPLIRQGRDLVIIHPCPPGRLKKYDVPLYRRKNGKCILHRIVRVRPDDYVTCGDNRWLRERGVTDQQIIGVLTGMIRKGKQISVTDRGYRLYVRLWYILYPIRVIPLWLRGLPRRIRKKLKR